MINLLCIDFFHFESNKHGNPKQWVCKLKEDGNSQDKFAIGVRWAFHNYIIIERTVVNYVTFILLKVKMRDSLKYVHDFLEGGNIFIHPCKRKIAFDDGIACMSERKSATVALLKKKYCK